MSSSHPNAGMKTPVPLSGIIGGIINDHYCKFPAKSDVKEC